MRITIIGSGNVATHLGAALKNAGHRMVQVYSRNIQAAALLAYHIGAEPTDNLNTLLNTNVFLVAVKDDAIAEVAKQLIRYNTLIVHTSGAVSLQTLTNLTDRAGVFYPLQTFSKEKEVNFRDVPLCIEGAGEIIKDNLIELAQTISNKVQLIDSGKRKILHLAAVFACNFPNYLYYVAQQLLQNNQLDFNLLKPLIAETADKIQDRLPSAVQTGPAAREDVQTMATHLQMLSDHAFLQTLYQLLSEGVAKMANAGNGLH